MTFSEFINGLKEVGSIMSEMLSFLVLLIGFIGVVFFIAGMVLIGIDAAGLPATSIP